MEEECLPGKRGGAGECEARSGAECRVRVCSLIRRSLLAIGEKWIALYLNVSLKIHDFFFFSLKKFPTIIIRVLKSNNDRFKDKHYFFH